MDASGEVELSPEEAVHLVRSNAVAPMKPAAPKAKGLAEKVGEFLEEEVEALTGSGKKKR